MDRITINEIFERVFEASQCSTQTELANVLGLKQSSISDAKKRKNIPASWLIKLLQLKGINPVWILTGEGSRFLQPSETTIVCPFLKEIINTKKLIKSYSSEELANELTERLINKQS